MDLHLLASATHSDAAAPVVAAMESGEAGRRKQHADAHSPRTAPKTPIDARLAHEDAGTAATVHWPGNAEHERVVTSAAAQRPMPPTEVTEARLRPPTPPAQRHQAWAARVVERGRPAVACHLLCMSDHHLDEQAKKNEKVKK